MSFKDPAKQKEYQRQSAASLEDQHLWEKPIDMTEFLVRQHSHRGDLILDSFGCSGPLSITRIRSDRRWACVESRDDNFRLGRSKIAGELARSRS